LSSEADHLTTPPRRSSPPARATRRSRRPAPRSTTFLERNRNRLLWALGGVAFLLIAGLAVLNFTTPAYACSNLFEPTPAPSWVAPTSAPVASGQTPGPAVTPPPPGFVQPDMGHVHVPTGDRVRFVSCPPASGKHYNTPGGPIRSAVYGPNDPTLPQGWIHNLEHGALVLLYNCTGDGCTDQGQAKLSELFAKWPASPICNIPAGNQTPVFTRFDDMAWPYAALVWDVVLPLQTLDEEQILRFYATQAERFNPEPVCAAPTPTPGPTPTAGPTGTAAPSVAPSATPSGTAPAASTAPTAG
jgi:hypothetical protein